MLINRLINTIETNLKLDIIIIDETSLKFKDKKHKRAWTTFKFADRKQLLVALHAAIKSGTITQPVTIK